MIIVDDWLRVLGQMGVRAVTAAKWSQAFADEVQPEKFSCGMRDLQDWLPQILWEYQLLEKTEESLTYNTPERLHEVWPSRFPTVASAVPYTLAPQKLANFVYGGRMGNVGPNDGWTYHGRPMLTGLDAYRLVGDLTGQDFVGLPDLMEQPHYGLCAMVHWWENRIPDSCLGDQVQIRRRVQGGELGLDHCEALAAQARQVLAPFANPR